MDIVGKRIKQHDHSSKDLEKSLKEGNIDLKSFVEQFMDERKAYHKFQIYKVKVSHG